MAEIIDAVQKDAVPSTWSVGDTKAMTIDGTEYHFQIIGKYHNVYSDGSGVAPLTFQLVECYNTSIRMDNINVSTSGWSGCEMRNTSLPNILSKMPSEVQSAIKAVDKETIEGLSKNPSNPTTIEITYDKLFLPSEIEVLGSTKKSGGVAEGSQYEYYANGGSPVKAKDGSETWWWLRGPYYDDQYYFGTIRPSGSLHCNTPNNANAISFAFCF